MDLSILEAATLTKVAVLSTTVGDVLSVVSPTPNSE